MPEFRLYIDESGDHRYRLLEQLDRRYLGLSGVLIRKSYYDDKVISTLQALKKAFFRYDPDRPQILVRRHIKNRKYAFGVLVDPEKNATWENAVLLFFEDLQAQIFTVVMDKKVHRERYPHQTFDPYVYGLAVLLNRVRGFLAVKNGDADVLVEARGRVEDEQIQTAYQTIRTRGFTGYGSAKGYEKAYPVDKLIFRRKDQDVAGLQIADLIAYGQTYKTVIDAGRPCHITLSDFTRRLNEAIERKVNRYGRYLLE